VADWIEDYFDWPEPPMPIRERIRENQFLDAIKVPQFVELSPSVTQPADPTGRLPAPSSSGQDTGLSRRRHGFNPRRGHRRQHRR
jgi:hypothetical protein